MCQSDTIPAKETGGEGTFILTELGTSGCVHSVTSIHKVRYYVFFRKRMEV